MKIVVAIDSFKGSASSLELGTAVKFGILAAFPHAEIKVFEIADGGEGTVSALQHGLQGRLVSVETVDLLQRPIRADYLLLKDAAVIEVAEVVGIDKLSPSLETIQAATTEGLAALILDAASQPEVKEIYLTLGGSGTSDGGRGLLAALGLDLSSLTGLPNLPKLIGLADVTNPYAGPTGFAHFFGPQKGGTAEILDAEDLAAFELVEKVKSRLGLDLQAIPGTGAAGGLGGAIAILGGTIEAGFPKIAALLKIEEALADADLVITGEGRMDAQTAAGKVPWGMAQLASHHQVPTLAFCGALADDLGEMDRVLAGAYSIQTGPIGLVAAMEKPRTLANMQRLAYNLAKTWFH